MAYRDEVYFHARAEPEVPFDEEEFAGRLRRIRAGMATAGIDCLFLTSPESLYYVSGYLCMWYQTESPMEWPASNGIAVHVDHDRFIHFETEREAVLTRTFTVSRDTRFFPRDSYRDGTRFIAEELKGEGWLKGSLGLECWAGRPNRAVSERFQGAFEAAGARVVDGSAIVREVRWKKSTAEMACLHEAARIAVAGLERAREVIRPGVSELEVQGEVVRALTAAGGEMPAMMIPVLSGAKTNACHAVATRRRMQAGELVVIDVAGVHKRYHVNAARAFSLGEPSPQVRDCAARAAGMMDRVRECLRPGLPVRELNEATRRYYEENGAVGKPRLGRRLRDGNRLPPGLGGKLRLRPTGREECGSRLRIGHRGQLRGPGLPATARRLLRRDRDPPVRRRGCDARHRADPLRARRNRVRPLGLTFSTTVSVPALGNGPVSSDHAFCSTRPNRDFLANLAT